MGWWSRKWAFLIKAEHSNAIVAVFSALLFATTVVYTVFAGFQWSATKQALHVDQRAWVVRNLDTRINLTIGQAISEPFWLTNAGKTPAWDVVATFRFEEVNAQDVPSFDYSAPHLSKMSSKIFYPMQTGPQGASLSLLQDIPGSHEPTSILLTQELLDRYNKREIVFVTYGKIEYGDAFKVRHLETFCSAFWNMGTFIHVQPNAVKACNDYAQADNNQ